MIDGLKLKVASAELRKHCQERSKYHDGRAAEKEKELPELRRILETIKGTSMSPAALSHMNKGGYSLDPEDAVTKLETDVKNHRNSALAFRFFSEHFFDGDYTLGEADLVRLEILRR